MRRALWASALFNLLGAVLFAFPTSLGQLVGFPGPVARVYSALLAFFVVLFGGAYAWLARQPHFDRPLVWLATVGKAGAFAVVLACWLAGEAPGRSVLAISGDLAFALVFGWWLLASRELVPPARAYHPTPGQPVSR